MQCPIDGSSLIMTDRSGVEIDYCPQCRGVWLDRGELDKIIERNITDPSKLPEAYPDAKLRSLEREEYHGKPHKKKRRDSFLSELFDF